nr:MAG: hypothetical protein [Bacteriophage sp.]
MKRFRIVELDRNYNKYRVDQLHHILFIPYWDNGSSDLSPYYYYNTKEEALMAIAKHVTKY